MNIFEKLNYLQSNLKVPKYQYNKFGKYFYRNSEDILRSLKPLLDEMKCAIVISDALEIIGDRYYIKSTVTLIDCEGDQKVESVAFAREEAEKKGMDSSQITGSTSTYARKYALNGLLCIDDSKSADDGEIEEAAKIQMIEEFKEEIKRTGKSLKYFLKEAEAESIDELAPDFIANAITMLGQCPTKGSGK